VLCLRKELLEMLRSTARNGGQPSVMLRALIAQLGPEAGDRPLWVHYFSEAFCFTRGQGYKIFGWFPDGTGALTDSDLNSLLFPRIQETRAEWDRPDSDKVEARPGRALGLDCPP
jgi:hypothetical protein